MDAENRKPHEFQSTTRCICYCLLVTKIQDFRERQPKVAATGQAHPGGVNHT